MNKLHPFECRIWLLAFSLSLLLYAGGGAAGYLWGRTLSEGETPPPVYVKAVNLSFAQMELVAVEEPPPPKEPEPLPPEEVDVVLKEIIEEPEPEPIQAEALVNQEAAAPEPMTDTAALAAWVQQQIEKEKYYPPSARRAGYEGTFDLLVIIEKDGTISEAGITYGRGHPMLRRALEKMLGNLPGRNYGQPLGQTVEMEVEFGFELN